MKEVINVINQSRTFLFIGHFGPDMDFLGSALALSHALAQKGKQCSILFQGDIPPAEEQLLSRVEHNLVQVTDFDVDAIIVMDTNSPELIPYEDIMASSAKKIMIDHHNPSPEIEKEFDAVISDDTAVSTTQLVYYLIKELGCELTKEIDLSVAAGLIEDSAHFIRCTPEMFRDLAEIFERGNVTYNEVSETVKFIPSLEDRISKINGVKNAKYTHVRDYLIAWTTTGGALGMTASALLQLGADVAFVGKEKAGDARISSRAHMRLVSKGFHLGRDIVPAAGKILGGEGGGHAGAAGANGDNAHKVDEALQECVDLTRNWILKSFKK